MSNTSIQEAQLNDQMEADSLRRHIVTEEGCPTCAELARGSFGPPHDASPRCESGKRPHCTCDTCF